MIHHEAHEGHEGTDIAHSAVLRALRGGPFVMLRGLVTGIRTLTVLPVPGREAEKMQSALAWFPGVGFLIGLIIYGACLLGNRVTDGAWPEGVAVIVMVIGIIITRGLHLDGLADWADGFWGARDRDRTLSIMKDSCTGAFGVLALVSILMAKWIALTRLIAADTFFIGIVAAYIVSRAAQAELAASFPYARPDGGTGAPLIRGGNRWHAALSFLFASVLLGATCGWPGLALLVLGWCIARVFGNWCHRRIGGVTGDLLGACSEIVETVILICYAGMGKGMGEFVTWEMLFK